MHVSGKMWCKMGESGDVCKMVIYGVEFYKKKSLKMEIQENQVYCI